MNVAVRVSYMSPDGLVTKMFDVYCGEADESNPVVETTIMVNTGKLLRVDAEGETIEICDLAGAERVIIGSRVVWPITKVKI